MHFVAEQLIAKAESFAGITAGIASLSSVLGGQSYKAIPNGNWEGRYSEKTLSWIPGARSLLVLAMYHPESNPELDWYYGGNTLGNRKLTDISNSLVA